MIVLVKESNQEHPDENEPRYYLTPIGLSRIMLTEAGL